MYRLYNPNTGEHFYTADKTEQQDLIIKGWTDEGIGWTASKSGDTVYRIYNPNVGEHLYTKSLKEYNNLTLYGWVKEGRAFYSARSSEVPIYRVYNSNQFAFNHHYTKSEQESKHLTKLGWSDEGIAFYGTNDSTTPETSTVTINYVDTAGNKIKDSTTESVEVGKDFTATAPSISEYTIQGETSQTLTNITSDQAITFTYQKNAPTTNYTVTVNYVDANDPSKIVKESLVVSVKKGESYTAIAPEITGYTVYGDPSHLIQSVTEETSLNFNYVNTDHIFTYDVSEKNATITGFKKGEDVSELILPMYVAEGESIYKVTSIGSRSFSNIATEPSEALYLKSVVIPNSVITIEAGAFYYNEIEHVTIPDSVTIIGEGAFNYNNLTSIEISSGITSIENYTFGSNQLNKVIIPKGVTFIGNHAFDSNQLESVIIPEKVTSIGGFAFYNNISLSSVALGNSLETIGTYAFATTNLSSVTIPDSVKSILDYAFYYNNNLTEASVPKEFVDTNSAFDPSVTALIPRTE
ncbi:leucine-rich repeat protein [Enterococcus sp. ALS3]|uniref:Leucine-rich repeat protein n=1 Tax=Enterococcus alishanensis TaxID=1303817 RepID=A0ABS6TI17_9ENTE|nr:leucine-rich repeat protein [Enterococcus alishanensis]MBV7392546.1 leucine-rich repeat protein [Enterococcus alishanensis]